MREEVVIGICVRKMSQINYIISKLEKYLNNGKSEYLAYEKFIVFEHYERFERFLKELPFPPIQIDFQLSSNCNLNCRWCIGKYITNSNASCKIVDSLDENLIKKIVDDINSLSIDDMTVETVMFSGLTGEPLIKKELLYLAVELLHMNKIKVCLFTNGTLMNKDTWKHLINIEAIQISLDGGKLTWGDIKRPNNNEDTYEIVLKNISGLVKYKHDNDGISEINIGYTITNENYIELEEVIKQLVNIGVNSICIKQDITNIEYYDKRNMISEIINECISKYGGINNVSILLMHENSNDNISQWRCTEGCYYRYFFTTIGSDGCVYPCDYQTINNRIRISDIRDEKLNDALKKKNNLWNEMIMREKFTNICPPFAEQINPFLAQVIELKNEFGVAQVLEAIDIIRRKWK